jgi:pyruvoyl-dependent arginine decarboxylase (PvlArgDC)
MERVIRGRPIRVAMSRITLSLHPGYVVPAVMARSASDEALAMTVA